MCSGCKCNALQNKCLAPDEEADRLSIKLIEEHGILELSIADNGVGFDQAEISADQRMGLQGMHERAELIGANLQIESQPGAGTQVHLRLERQPEGQP